VLEEETMNLAWGPENTPEDRRRIVLAAIIFGRQFNERMQANPPENLEEEHFQRFLMSLMNAVITEFAERENIDETSAAAFLGDITTRDYILEFNEVLEEFVDEPDKPLDELLRSAVENRQEHARWARHWSSG
jgi:hypothetical protein